MLNLPIINYKDLYQLWNYSDRLYNLNGVVADDSSLAVMLRIEKTMQRLKVMGDDDRRILWIRIKAPARYRYGILDDQKFYWCQLLTAHYEDLHYLILENPDGWRRQLVLCNNQTTLRKRGKTEHTVDVKDGLLLLEEYVTALVDSICKNPDIYNSYVEKNLPYGLRKGRIRRSDLNRLLPDYKIFKDARHAVDVLDRQQSLPLFTSERMTLRSYMHVWRIAYEGYVNGNDWMSEQRDISGMRDEEVFRRFSSKGRETEGLDLDSERVFEEWNDANSSFHNNDVAYARIHLWPVRNGEFRDSRSDIPDGSWYFVLNYSVGGYSRDMINILDSLIGAGINVDSHSVERLRRMTLETDFVSISPHPNKYHHTEEEGDEIYLPSRKPKSIIKAVEWYPQQRVEPMD